MTLAVGPRVPRRGNAFSSGLARLLLRIMGWRLTGTFPDEPKMVLIAGPHTSNMDGVIGIATLMALRLRCSTMIKDSAFKGLFGRFLLWAGAIPVNRRSPKGVVEQSVEAFEQRSQMLLLIAPEGTRDGAAELKRGFYHIASSAQVPILVAAADYQAKVITFGPLIRPSGDYPADLKTVLEFIHNAGYPRHPDRLSRPLQAMQHLPRHPPDATP